MNFFEEDDDIFPLTENLSNSYVDPSNLVTYVSQAYPIGMDNFRQKKSVTKSIRTNISLAKHRWLLAAAKLKILKDPWSEFHIDKYETETVIRHRYNAIKKQWITDECKIKIEDKQFANGAMRACYRLKKLSNFVHKESWEHAANYVAKSYMDPEIPRDRYFDDVRLQMDAKLWAEIYNRHNPPKKIDMFQMSILEFINRPNRPLFHLEHFIEGEYIKYNSNSGFVEDKRATPQAFSHFTFECSKHELMVVDIQGVGDLYTDPQIHTAKGDDYGDGNLGCKGYALFFSSHVCNHVCKSLGLTEFDLSSNEMQKLKCKKSPSPFSGTICRGREELVVGSPTSYSEFLRKRARNMSTCSDDLESEGYESSSSSPVLSPNSTRPMAIPYKQASNQMMINSPRGRIRTESNCLDSAFSYDEAQSYFNKIDARQKFRPRPSCVYVEKDLLNRHFESDEDEQEAYDSYENLSNNEEESILGKVHVEFARYHEMGRFNENETDYDQVSAFYHLKHAADLGVKEAIINVAKIYLGLPHDLLGSYTVDETDENLEMGFSYLTQSADCEDKNSLFILAKAYDTGVNLPKSREIDWNTASCYYKKLIQLMEDEACSEDDGYCETLGDCDPIYSILARLAEMNLKGGHNLPKNAQMAASLYTEAAEKSMQCGKGRIANKYYMLSEEAASQEED